MKKRIVAVEHNHKKYAKEYWFNVPETVTCELQVGDTVYCDTCRGVSKGYITKIIETDEAQEANHIKLSYAKKADADNLFAEPLFSASFSQNGVLSWSGITSNAKPTKDIIGKKIKFNIGDIKISKDMRRTRPRIEKLQGKLAEYYMHGKSALSPIIIKSSGELIDGYTTYLIHKMFDLPVKYVIMV